jgi:ABC-type polysaccharide/polyol phosphate transport system ATPase subunit
LSAALTHPDETSAGPRERATALQLEHVSKTFRIPHQRYSTLKERALHPLRSRTFDELRAVDDVTLDIAPGEFFGIVGRNGSGKSTLLKCLAGIYRTDHGQIGVNGRLAPFIELGVGFNPDLNARDNVVLNAIMMTRCSRSATRRSSRSASRSSRSSSARAARSCSSPTTWARCSGSVTARC